MLRSPCFTSPLLVTYRFTKAHLLRYQKGMLADGNITNDSEYATLKKRWIVYSDGLYAERYDYTVFKAFNKYPDISSPVKTHVQTSKFIIGDIWRAGRRSDPMSIRRLGPLPNRVCPNVTPVQSVRQKTKGGCTKLPWYVSQPFGRYDHGGLGYKIPQGHQQLQRFCPACRTTLIATRFRVAVICPIIQVPHCIRVFFYFVWFVFINHIFQFYNELCTYCNILDIYLS